MLFPVNNDTLRLFFAKKLSCAGVNIEKRQNSSSQDFKGNDKGLYAKMNYGYIDP